ncbi:hypothetical protein, partial [Marinobacterium rhizophilum]|uniref:hypothetical protein n=1 Tax=Marinobacterium rhizophilum TaxID=420402 RepID=UPI001969B824
LPGDFLSVDEMVNDAWHMKPSVALILVLWVYRAGWFALQAASGHCCRLSQELCLARNDPWSGSAVSPANVQ